MGKYAVIVIGPAGSGKTTFCRELGKYCKIIKRNITVCNLDPAAEHERETIHLDIRDLIIIEEVMEQLHLGPNGGLMYCMEYLLDNKNWMDEQFGGLEDDYLIIDCPGQIELFTNSKVMQEFVKYIQYEMEYNVCTVYIVDGQIIKKEPHNYIAASLLCMSSMIHFSTPHINIFSKIDLLKQEASRKKYKKYLEPDADFLLNQLNASDTDADTSKAHNFINMNKAIVGLFESYPGMVEFIPFDKSDKNSIDMILNIIDMALQYEDEPGEKELEDAMEQEVFKDFETMAL